jgi:hypothetical protein
MNKLESIQKRVLGKGNEDEQVVQTMFVIMKEFGYTLEEMQSTPITTFKYLIHFLNKEAEANKKAMRRKR